MFSSTKSKSNFLGVPLDELQLILSSANIKTSLDGSTLVGRHDHYTTSIEVVPPEHRESEIGPIRAVVRITTELPGQVQELFQAPEMTVLMNSFAALGALTWERGKVFVGSRLTIYETEDAWDTLHLPLLACTAIFATEAILGGIRRSFAGECQQGVTSAWTDRDMEQVHKYLSKICVCNTCDLRLTAEFGLADGAVSAMEGDHNTALFQLMADEPHPELAGGLFCLLQMPHQISDEKRLKQLCLQLNNMEMAARDMPPHFGAWCIGKLGNNPVYVSFFPNVLHAVSGIAVNAAFWALGRARRANAMLASLGVNLRS